MKNTHVSLFLLVLLLGSMASTISVQGLIFEPTTETHSTIIFAEKNDAVASKSVDLFDQLFDSYVDYSVYYISDYTEMIDSSLWSSSASTFIYVFHGDKSGLVIGSNHVSWKRIALDVQNTHVKTHLFVSCYSNTIKKYIGNSYYDVRGFDKAIDYFPATVITAIEYGEIHTPQNKKDNPLLVHISEFINDEDNYVSIIGRTINPIETMEALHWKNPYYKKFQEFINNTLHNLGLDDPNGPINTIIRLFYQIFTSEDPPEVIITEQDVENIIIKAINKFLHFEFSKGPIKIEFAASVKEQVFSEDVLDADVYSKVLQIFTKITLRLEKEVVVYGVPITSYVDISGFFYFDILLEYYASDHNNPGATINSSYNGKLYRSTTGNPDDTIYKLIGYSKIPSQYGERTLEVWFTSRCPIIGFTRFYGGIIITPGSAIVVDFAKYTANENDTGLVKKLKSMLPKLTIGPDKVATIWVVATETDDGIDLLFSATKYGLPNGQGNFVLNLEFETPVLKVTLDVQFKMSFTLDGHIKIRSNETIFEKFVIYWPVLEARFKISGEIGLGPIKKEFDFSLIDRMGGNAIFLPFGTKTSPSTYIANVLWEAQLNWKVPWGMKFVEGGFHEIAGAEITEGSAFDHTPPFVTFITPNSQLDQSINYGSSGSISFTIYQQIIQNGAKILKKIGNLIGCDLLGDFGSIPLIIHINKTLPLSGDNATLEIYTFDEHPVINGNKITNNKVSSVYLYIDDPEAGHTRFETVSVQATLSQSNPEYSYTLSKTGVYMVRPKVRIHNPNVSGFALAFMSSSGSVRQVGYGNDIEIWGPWYSGNTIHLARGEIIPGSFEYYIVNGELVLDPHYIPRHVIAPSTKKGVSITVEIVGIQYKAGHVWRSTSSSSNDNGFIELVSSQVDAAGVGEVSGKRGWKGIWKVHMDLYRRMDQYNLKEGWHMFYAVAIDNAGLVSKASKLYYVEKPCDWEAPIISANHPLSVNPPSESSAIPVGERDFDFTFEDRKLTLEYNNLPYGSGTHRYTVFSGVDINYPSQLDIYVNESSKVLRTVSSGTDNGFRLWFTPRHSYNTDDGHRPRYTDRVEFNFVAKPSDNFWYLFIRIDTTHYHMYLTYHPGNFQPYYVSSGYLHLPLNLKKDDWNNVKLDLLHDLHTKFPFERILTVDAFLARGNWMFDDISIDNIVYFDFERHYGYGYEIYDTYPSGAQISVIYAQKTYKAATVSGSVVSHTSTEFKGKLLYSKIVRRYHVNLYDILGLKIYTVLRFILKSADNEGNTMTYAFWLAVYKPIPATIGVSSPGSSVDGNTNVNLKIHAVDPNGISSVKAVIMKGSSIINTVSMSYSNGYYTANWMPPREGTYRIVFKVYDIFGCMTQKTVTLSVGDFAGTLTISLASYLSSTKKLYVKAYASDPDGIAYIKVYIDNKYYGTLTKSSNYWYGYFGISSLAYGTHTLKLVMYDSEGDTTYATKTFRKVPPGPGPGPGPKIGMD